MREYNMTRLSGVTMIDEVMRDAQDEQMTFNMTSVTPHGLSGVATTDKVVHGAQEQRMALKMPIATPHSTEEGKAHAKINIGIYSCVVTRFLTSIDMPILYKMSFSLPNNRFTTLRGFKNLIFYVFHRGE